MKRDLARDEYSVRNTTPLPPHVELTHGPGGTLRQLPSPHGSIAGEDVCVGTSPHAREVPKDSGGVAQLPSPSEEVLGSSQGHGTASSGEGKPRDAGESPAPVLIRTSAPDESCATCFGVHGNPPCPGTSAAPVPDESRQSRICKPWCGHDGHHQLYQEADETLLCGNAFAEPGWEDAKTGEPANRRWCSAVCRDQRFPPKKPEYEPKTVEQRLGYLIEECGEVLQAAGKSIRWGLQSVNPELPASQQESNQEWLRRELKDLKAAIRRIEDVL